MGEITLDKGGFVPTDQVALSFDCSSAEGVVKMNMHQLQCLLDAGSHTAPVDLVKADINAYRTILERNLCREYKNWRKNAMNTGNKDRMPRHFVLEKKIYSTFG